MADTSPWRMDSYPEKPKHSTPLFWRTLTPLDPITLSQCFVTMSSLYTTPSLSATVRGCYFHYSQALWRRLQREDLVLEYQVENSPIRKAFKMIKALPFVPEHLIPTAWRNLKPTLPDDMRTFCLHRLLRAHLGWDLL